MNVSQLQFTFISAEDFVPKRWTLVIFREREKMKNNNTLTTQEYAFHQVTKKICLFNMQIYESNHILYGHVAREIINRQEVLQTRSHELLFALHDYYLLGYSGSTCLC